MKVSIFSFVLVSCSFSQLAFGESDGDRWNRIEIVRKESEASLVSLNATFELYRQDASGLELLAEKVRAHNEILGRLHEAYRVARADNEGWVVFVEKHPEHAGRNHWEYFSNIMMDNQIAFGHMTAREIDFKRSGWEGFSSALRESRFHLGRMAYYDPNCHLVSGDKVMCGGELYKRVTGESKLEVVEEFVVEAEK
jgi:hypothetical protein